MDSQPRVPELLKVKSVYDTKGDPAKHPIHERYRAVLKYANRAGRWLTIMVNISAVIVIAGACALGVFTARAVENGAFSTSTLQRFSNQLGSFAPLIIVEFVLLTSLVIYLVVCAVAALINAHELFAKYKEVTKLELAENELGLVIADEGLWKQLIGKLERSFVFKLRKMKHYQGLERHLLFCACHWRSLEQISRGTVRYSNFKLRQSQQDFNSLNMFYRPSVPTIIGIVLLGILFFFHGLIIYPTVLVANGSRNIIVYARLAALAEFYLGEPEAAEKLG